MGQGSTLVVAKDIVLVLLATTMGRNVMTFIFRDKQNVDMQIPLLTRVNNPDNPKL